MLIKIIDAGHGDCILIECGDTLILVDSGPRSFKIRSRVVNALKNTLRNRPIDVAIVSHNDDDHIGGFKHIVKSGIVIKTFIFNSLKYISQVLQDNKKNKQISYNQDDELNNVIESEAINVLPLNASDSSVFLNKEVKITPLTPYESALVSMHEDSQRKQKQISKGREKEPSISECLDLIRNKQDLFNQDTSITNKTSLSIIIEYKDRALLCLGDSHEDDVIKSLNCNKKIPFNAVKLSHHGSERNTSSELLALIGKTEYILCGDKSRHALPNRKTIGRILTFDKNPTFHLSSCSVELREMFEECVNEGFDVDVTYPTKDINRVSYE